jgi:hypothetical protein
MTPADAVLAAFHHCPAVETKSLEQFLDVLLDEDLESLAQMPGTPGQVMASQFTYYVKSSVTLSESLRRDTEHSSRLCDSVLRLRTAKSRSAAKGR